MSLPLKLLVGVGLFSVSVVGALIVLRLYGLIWPFSVPTGAMTPAIVPGDHLIVEGFTFFISRQPRRGDIVVFRTEGLPLVPPGQFYVKRVAGEPGDRVRISDGRLFINDKQVSISNALGEIAYNLPQHSPDPLPQTDVTVPSNSYFVLGDNSTNSLDSRYWGSLPRGNIIGRVAYCYFPLQRIGLVK